MSSRDRSPQPPKRLGNGTTRRDRGDMIDDMMRADARTPQAKQQAKSRTKPPPLPKMPRSAAGMMPGRSRLVKLSLTTAPIGKSAKGSKRSARV